MLFGGMTVTDIVELLVALIISMVIHEFMHGFVAFKLGDTTAMEHGRLSFNPLKHIDPFMTIVLPAITLLVFQVPVLAAKPVPFNPSRLKFDDYGSAMVAAAGPLSNLALALLAVLVSLAIPLDSFAANAFGIFIQINVILFVFNLVPIPPLDGSRIVYAFAPDAVRAIFDQVEPFGFFIIIALLYLHGFDLLTNIYQMVLNLLGSI
jgi:Zn-dependent protease